MLKAITVADRLIVVLGHDPSLATPVKTALEGWLTQIKQFVWSMAIPINQVGSYSTAKGYVEFFVVAAAKEEYLPNIAWLGPHPPYPGPGALGCSGQVGTNE